MCDANCFNKGPKHNPCNNNNYYCYYKNNLRLRDIILAPKFIPYRSKMELSLKHMQLSLLTSI